VTKIKCVIVCVQCFLLLLWPLTFAIVCDEFINKHRPKSKRLKNLRYQSSIKIFDAQRPYFISSEWIGGFCKHGIHKMKIRVFRLRNFQKFYFYFFHLSRFYFYIEICGTFISNIFLLEIIYMYFHAFLLVDSYRTLQNVLYLSIM
jgi:hypothetical protein